MHLSVACVGAYSDTVMWTGSGPRKKGLIWGIRVGLYFSYKILIFLNCPGEGLLHTSAP